MYIKKITLKNIRCFKDITIDLSSENGIKKWTVILGDNGAGKTTLLRCIAIGICDEDEAKSLLQDLETELIRRESGDIAKIIIEFYDSNKGTSAVTTHLRRTKDNEEFLESRKGDLLKNIFACGYGANRGIGGKEEPAKIYSVADAVYTLINYKHSLFDYEKLFWRITGGKRDHITRICKWIHYILMLPEKDKIDLTSGGVRIITADGLDLPISACGDGYEATTTWIMDLLGRFFQTVNLDSSKK